MAEFLRQEAAGSPLGGVLQSATAERRVAVGIELESALDPYVDDDGLLVPMQCWLVTAHRTCER